MCKTWPDLEAPQQHKNPAEGWKDPALPDIKLIWKLAREVGYAVGVHGSLKRDFDLIAAPWTDEAVEPLDLILHVCHGLKGKLIGEIVKKPQGRIGVNIQLNGWFKVIDLSVMPLSPKIEDFTSRPELWNKHEPIK